MSSESSVVQCPDPIETADLHFKALSRLKVFDVNGASFQGSMNLLAVSQYFGLVFVGTSNGFLILKSETVFSATKPDEFSQRKVVLNMETTHLALDFEQKNLAVGCLAKGGPVIQIYNITTFLSKGVIPCKTVPLSKPFQMPAVLLCELMWQPNIDSCLTVCLTDGSVSSINLFLGSGDDILTLPNTIQARCLCWSPKGKQLVIGSSDGSLSQYKPDFKLVKKLPPPPIFNGAVTIVNLLWISSFQFIAGYKDGSKAEGFPFAIIVVNAQKNEPIKFINYDDITYSSILFRAHQVYFHHQSAWNTIYVASANSVEVAVLHAREDNNTWQQWLLGDASRAELPLNSDRVETYPLGLAVDYTSDQPIPWGEDSLPPMPRLLLLSSEGVLTTFHIVSTSPKNPQLCSPPKESFDDSWFTFKEKIDDSSDTTKVMPDITAQANLPEGGKPMANLPSVAPFSPLGSSSTTSQDGEVGSSRFAAFKIQPSNQQQDITQQAQDQRQESQSVQPTVSSALSNTNSSTMWTLKPAFPFGFPANRGVPSGGEIDPDSSKNTDMFKNSNQNANIFASRPSQKEETKFLEAKENLGTQKQLNGAERANSSFPANGDHNKSGSTDQPVDVKNSLPKTPDSSPSRGTPDFSVIDESVYIGALLEEIDQFNGEMKEVLSRLSNLTVNIGSEDEKMNLRKSVEKMGDFERGLTETTCIQKSEIDTLKADMIEAFVWLEDARSRNRQRKSPTFIELKKLEDLDPMSSLLMGEIGHLKYYIENQLKQLNSYLMKQLMEHQDTCRFYVKSMMSIPSMEELYKTLYLELKILSEERSIVEDLKRQIAEKSKRGRMQMALLKNSPDEHSKSVANDRVSELFKLADNFLQIKIDQEEDVNDVYVADAFQLMVKNQINAIAERLKKFTEEKENILRDVFSEREIMKTRSIKSTFGSSSFVRNTSSRILSKYSATAKATDRDKLEKIKKVSVSSSVDSSVNSEKASNFTCDYCKPVNVSEATTSEAFLPVSREPAKSVFSIAPLQSAADKEREKVSQTFTFSSSKLAVSSTTKESDSVKSTDSGIGISTPLVFKAPALSTQIALTPAAKPAVASPERISSVPVPVNTSVSSTNNSVFSLKVADASSVALNSGQTYTFTTDKVSFIPPASQLDGRVPASGLLPQSTSTEQFTTPALDIRTSSTVATISRPIFTSSLSGVPIVTSSVSNSSLDSSTSTIFQRFTFSRTLASNKSSNETSLFPISKQPIDSTPITVAISTTEKMASTPVSSKPNFTFGGSKAPVSAAEVKVIAASQTDQVSNRSEPIIALSGAVDVIKNAEATSAPVVVKSESAQQQDISKTERVSGKIEEKEGNDKKISPTGPIVISTITGASDGGQESAISKASTFPQSYASTVFSVSTTNSSIFGAPTSTQSISFATTSNSDSSIFDRSDVSSSTSTASIFSSDRTTIFSQPKVTTTSSFFNSVGAITTTFGQPASTTVASVSIFGQATPTTSTSSFGQTGKDDIGQTAKLFGDVLGTGLTQGNVFTPSTSASGNIFGKSAFEKSGVSIFGNTPATTTSVTSSTSIFGNASSNIFSKSSFGQSPTSNSSNIFGQAQPTESNNTFFRQNICNTFGNTSTGSSNQGPFGSSGGFSNKPIFGQSLFGQSNTGQNPFERSASSNIFVGATTTSNPFQSTSSSFGSLPHDPFSGGSSTAGQSGLGTSQAFQKPLTASFGGSPVFGNVLSPTPAFGAPPTFGGAPTFGSAPHFGNMQKVFGSPQGTFGQSQANAPNFETLASQSADGFANLAQQSQSQAFGGNTFSQGSGFGNNPAFAGTSFSGWRS